MIVATACSRGAQTPTTDGDSFSRAAETTRLEAYLDAEYENELAAP